MIRTLVANSASKVGNFLRDNETGLLCDPDVKAMAEKIRKLYEDDGLRERLSKNALKWSKKFSWDESKKKFSEILREVVLGGSRMIRKLYDKEFLKDTGIVFIASIIAGICHMAESVYWVLTRKEYYKENKAISYFS